MDLIINELDDILRLRNKSFKIIKPRCFGGKRPIMISISNDPYYLGPTK